MVVRQTRKSLARQSVSPGGVRRRSGKLETGLTIKKRQREKVLGGKLVTIGGKEVLIKVEQPKLFTGAGEVAKPDIRGVVRGFSRADLTRIKGIERQEVLRKAEKEKLVKDFTTQEIVSKLPSGRIVDVARTPSVKERIKSITTEQIIQTLPVSRGISKITERKGPTKKKVVESDIKPIPKLTKLEKVKKQVVKVETFVSEKTGLSKVAGFEARGGKARRDRLQREIKTLKTGDVSVLDKIRIAKREKDIFFSEVGSFVTQDVLRKPVSNAALILVSAGVTKVAQLGGLGLVKLAGKSPKIAKVLGVSGKVASGGLGAAYITGVGFQAANELKNKGSLSKTTADVVRELALFGLGAKIGSSVKLQKLTKLKADINALPKEARVKLNKRFSKLEKVAAKEFKTKDLGIVTSLDSQTLTRSVGNALKGRKTGVSVRGDIVTSVENKIFFAKSVPKKTKTFEVTQYFLNKKASSLGEVTQAGKVVYNARFVNGKVQIFGKPKKVDFNIGREELSGLVKRFGRGKVETVVRKVPVRATIRKRSVVGVTIDPVLDIKQPITYFDPGVQSFKFSVPDVKVKGTVRKIKKVFQLKREKISDFKPSFAKVDKVESFVQFQINPKTKKLKVSKVDKVGKPKFDELIAFDIKTGEGLQIKKISSSIQIPKEVVSKPVIGVTPEIKGFKPFVLPPIQKSKTVSKPVISKPTRIQISKPRIITKPRTVQKPISKPKIQVLPAQVTKDIVKAGTKPRISVKVAQKPIQEIKPVQLIKPKISVKVAQQLLRKPKIARFKSLGQKPVVIKPFSFVLPKFGKKKFKSVPVVKKSFDFTKFTTTITRPKKGKGKGLKFGEIELFTGAELR